MGPESKIEFGSGTLYFGPLDGDGVAVGSINIEDFSMTEEETTAFEASDTPIYINKIIQEPVEFTATIDNIRFRGLVVLIGFWPAVKWKVRGWWKGFKNLWGKRYEKS